MTATSPQIRATPGVLNTPAGLAGVAGYNQAALSWNTHDGGGVVQRVEVADEWVRLPDESRRLQVGRAIWTRRCPMASPLLLCGECDEQLGGAERDCLTAGGFRGAAAENTGFETPIYAGTYAYNPGGASVGLFRTEQHEWVWDQRE